jgi:hypothetical protein
LLKGHADHYFMTRNTYNFSARLFYLGNMFKNFGAENAVKVVIGKVKLRDVTGNRNDAREIKRWSVQVKRCHRIEVGRK